MTRIKKLSAGQYILNGFLIQRVENVDGNTTSEWDICEETPGGWVACDRLATLRDCKAMIERTF